MSSVLGLSIKCLNAAQNAKVITRETELCDKVLRDLLPVMELFHSRIGTDNSIYAHYESSFLEGLLKVKTILEKVSKKCENYFCTFKYELYSVEMNMLLRYVRELTVACDVALADNTRTYDPLCRLFSLSCTPSFSIPELLSRLFWLKYFKLATEVDWLTYRESFVLEYGAHHEYNLNKYKVKLVNDGKSIVTLDRFVTLSLQPSGVPPLSVYEAFQNIADEGYRVLITGLLVEGTDGSEIQPIWSPQLVFPLLGLKVVQIACGGQHAAGAFMKIRIL
jgi:hypothetical protein